MPPQTRRHQERLLQLAEEARIAQLQENQAAQLRAAQAAAQAVEQAALAAQSAEQQVDATTQAAKQAGALAAQQPALPSVPDMQHQDLELAATQQEPATAQAVQQAVQQAAQQAAAAAAAAGPVELAAEGGPETQARLALARRTVYSDHEIALNEAFVTAIEGDEFDDSLSRSSNHGPSRDGRFINGGVHDEMYLLVNTNGDCLEVPDGQAFPPVVATNPMADDQPLMVAPEHLFANSVFVKRPRWYDVADQSPYRVFNLMQEVYMNDLLAKKPHPHIARYLGVRVRRNCITGLVFERLPVSLRELSPQDFAQINQDDFFCALRNALSHLHHQGLAYNDLKPANIMVRDGLPYLIDFGSAAVAGTRLIGTAYTNGWARPELYARRAAGQPIFSDRENDRYALQLLWSRFTYEGIQTHYG